MVMYNKIPVLYFKMVSFEVFICQTPLTKKNAAQLQYQILELT